MNCALPPLAVLVYWYCLAATDLEAWAVGHRYMGGNIGAALSTIFLGVVSVIFTLGVLAWSVRALWGGRFAAAAVGILATPLPLVSLLFPIQAYRAGILAARQPAFLDSLAAEMVELRGRVPADGLGLVWVHDLPGRFTAIRRAGGIQLMRFHHAVAMLCGGGTVTLRRRAAHAGWDLYWAFGRWRLGHLIWRYSQPRARRSGPPGRARGKRHVSARNGRATATGTTRV